VNVVVRGLMAAGMAVYAAIHTTQAASPPADAPAWLAFAFAATALVAIGLAVMLIVTSVRAEPIWETLAAVLAGSSAVALLLSYTTGFLGVVQSDLRAETAIVAVAELVTLGAFAVGRGVIAGTREDILEEQGSGPSS
jgi:hypothetical protein